MARAPRMLHVGIANPRWRGKRSRRMRTRNFTYLSRGPLKFVMMTISNVNTFRVTGPLCREFTGHRWVPLAKASDAGFWCFLWSALHQAVRLSKQSRRRLFETPSRSLWRHCNGSTRHQWVPDISCDLFFIQITHSCVRVWRKFYLRCCHAVCNNVLYCTAIYPEPIVPTKF